MTTKGSSKKPVETKVEKKRVSYRVLVGANFPGKPGKPERRIRPGEVVDDLPERVIPALLKAGAIEEVK